MRGVSGMRNEKWRGAMPTRRASVRPGDANSVEEEENSEAAVRRELAWTLGVCAAVIVAVNLLAAWLGVH
jgi:hypothetical protein